MIDSLMMVVDLVPEKVKAIGFSQKMPSLSPIPVLGYELIDTLVTFNNGSIAHIITGWHLPNSAPDLTAYNTKPWLVGFFGDPNAPKYCPIHQYDRC